VPIALTTFQLPGGARCVRVSSSGHVSGEDAATYVRETSPGSPLAGLPHLVVTAKQESISPEARAVFAGNDTGGQEPWVAVVAANPVIRVANNFLIRVQRRKRVRIFGTEPEAIQWLDEQTRPAGGTPVR
jgi:hypothetical protein